MKKSILISVLFLFSISVFSQINEGRQISPRLNISVTPGIQFVKVAGAMNFAAGLSVATIINDKFFWGFNVSKKVQRNYIDYGAAGGELDISYQHHGITLGRYFGLGIYKAKDGRFFKRKTRLVFSTDFEYAVLWTVNRDKEKVSSREYFYGIKPAFGVRKPIGKFLFLEFGALYSQAVRIDSEWEAMNITNKEFSGPGAYFSVSYNLFRTDYRRNIDLF